VTPTARDSSREIIVNLRLKGKTYADTFDLESIQFYSDSKQFPESCLETYYLRAR
jgi:hypothetical protein